MIYDIVYVICVEFEPHTHSLEVTEAILFTHCLYRGIYFVCLFICRLPRDFTDFHMLKECWKSSIKLLMFGQNGWLVPSIRSHNPPSRLLPIRGVEFRIPSQDPERQKNRKETHEFCMQIVTMFSKYVSCVFKSAKCILFYKKY